MKHIILPISLFLFCLSGFAQVTDYEFTFEPGTTLGAWNYFENGTNTNGVSFVNNPFPGGVNSSATVAKFTAAGDGGEWAGCESLYGTLGKWKFNGASPTTVTIDVYKKTLTPVVIKFTSTNPSGQGTVFVGTSTPSAINQWVTLTYIVDFASLGGVNNADNNFGTNQFVIHVDKNAARGTDQDVYFDNLKFSATKLADPITPPVPVPAPTTTAPTPPGRATNDVVSIFSDAYTNLIGTKIGKNWGEATNASNIVVDNDTIKRLLRFNYQGIVLSGPVNLTGFEKVHIDFFKTDQEQLKFSIIHEGGGDITKLLTISNPGWNTFDLPLTDFVGLNLSKVFQLKLEGAPTQGNTTVYFDNLYFYRGLTAVGDMISNDFRAYPNPASSAIKVEASAPMSKVSVFNSLGKEVLSVTPHQLIADLKIAHLDKGIYFIQSIIQGRPTVSRFVKE